MALIASTVRPGRFGRSGHPARPVLVVLRALGLGDLLVALPALRALCRHHRDHQIVVATTAGVAPLARLALDGEVSVIGVAALGALPLRSGVDVAVNLHGRGPQSHRVLAALGPRRTVGFDLAGGPPWPEGCHETHRWAGLVDTLLPPGRCVDRDDLDLDPGRLDLDPDGQSSDPIRVDPASTIVHPGAKDAARRWPLERWIEVARAERRRGHRVVVTGSSSERALTASLVAGAGLSPSCDRSGTTDVVELASLIASAGRVVCGDTGVGHLATALGRPSVLLFGPSDPAVWGPPPHRRHHVVLWHGGTGDPHATVVDPSLLAITVSEVLGALEGLGGLEARTGPAGSVALARSGLGGPELVEDQGGVRTARSRPA